MNPTSNTDTLTPPSVPPRYVSHLEHMKSRLDALERKPLSRASNVPNVAVARKRSQIRIGRTRTMTNLYSPPRFESSSNATDENRPPLSANYSPPRLSKHRSQIAYIAPKPQSQPHLSYQKDEDEQKRHQQQELYAQQMKLDADDSYGRPTSNNVVKTLGEDDFHSVLEDETISSSSSPQPRKAVSRVDKTSVLSPSDAGAPTTPDNPAAKARPGHFSIDAPEELLCRPQSHAAARDIQRYSLKVARRLGPVKQQSSLSENMPAASFAATTNTAEVLETSGLPNGGRLGPVRSEMIGVTYGNSGSSAVNGAAEPNLSTIDTVMTTGSGGRVVEEMQGDVWVRKGSIWKRWRRRYASIVSHQFFGRVLCLFSYDSTGNVISTKSEIVVLSGALCRSIRETVDLGGEVQAVFVLRTAKEYYFATNADTTRRQWVRELRQAARLNDAAATTQLSIPLGRRPSIARMESPVQALPPRKTNPLARMGGVGRSATHHGSQSGGLPLTRSRRGPFRRAIDS
jgi:hypothetical protein